MKYASHVLLICFILIAITNNILHEKYYYCDEPVTVRIEIQLRSKNMKMLFKDVWLQLMTKDLGDVIFIDTSNNKIRLALLLYNDGQVQCCRKMIEFIKQDSFCCEEPAILYHTLQ